MNNVAPISQDKIKNLVDYIKLEDVKTSSDCQPRESINTDTVSEYAEQMAEGADFPPITVFNDGKVNWLADGFHRYHAANEADLAEIKATIRIGTKRDAILFSCGANAKHGLRRSNEDKRRAVMALLNDDEWTLWSNREISRKCDVSDVFVNKVRTVYLQTFADNTSSYPVTLPDRTQRKCKRGDTEYTVSTSNIGKSNVVEVEFNEDLSEYEDDGDLSEYEDDGELLDHLEALGNPDKGLLRGALDIIRRFCGKQLSRVTIGKSKEELQELDSAIDRIMNHCQLLKEEIAKCE